MLVLMSRYVEAGNRVISGAALFRRKYPNYNDPNKPSYEGTYALTRYRCMGGLMKNPMIFLYLFFIVIGILSLVAGVINYAHEEAIFAAAEHATATITEYVPNPNPKVADFCPVYEFTTKAGQEVSYVGDSCPNQPDPSKIGQHEEVYYDPKNPQVVETRGWFGSEGRRENNRTLSCWLTRRLSLHS